MIDSTVGTRTNLSSDVEADLEPKTLGEAIRRNTAAAPEAVVIVSSAYEPFSCGQLAAQLDHFAAALGSAGFGRESHVAIALKDASDRLGLLLGSPVPFDPTLTAAESETPLKLLDLDAVIVLANDDSPVRDAPNGMGWPSSKRPRRPSAGSVSGLSCLGRAPAPPNDLEPEALAFLLQTSGTTAAEPKWLMPYSHRNMLPTAARVKRWFNPDDDDDRCQSMSPVY